MPNTNTNNFKYDQSFFKSLGNYGCYFLCLLHIAEQKGADITDIKAIAKKAKEKGYIVFNEANYNDSDNFFVKNPCGILKMLVGGNWKVALQEAGYKPQKNEYVVEFWSKGGKTGHFAMTRQGYNPLQKSVNVEQGKIASLRILSFEA